MKDTFPYYKKKDSKQGLIIRQKPELIFRCVPLPNVSALLIAKNGVIRMIEECLP